MTTTPRTWVVGEVVTAALLNTEIRDQWNSVIGAWTSWTPSWLAEGGANPTLGNGTITGRYLKVGRTVDWALKLTWGSTTAPGGGAGSENWTFTLPAAPSSSFTPFRFAMADAYDQSTGVHYGAGGTYDAANGGQVRAFVANDGSSSAIWDSSAPFTWVSGDILYAWGRYEAAS